MLTACINSLISAMSCIHSMAPSNDDDDDDDDDDDE